MQNDKKNIGTKLQLNLIFNYKLEILYVLNQMACDLMTR
jgi:hypothetical protein